MSEEVEVKDEAPEEKAPKPRASKKKASAKPGAPKMTVSFYKAVKHPIFDPYLKKMFTPAMVTEVEGEISGWLVSQIEAGIIIKVK